MENLLLSILMVLYPQKESFIQVRKEESGYGPMQRGVLIQFIHTKMEYSTVKLNIIMVKN